MTGNLAADVADQPADPRAPQLQLPMVAVELLGVGVAPAIKATCLATRRYDCRSRTACFLASRTSPRMARRSFDHAKDAAFLS
jgi:hypothetical protein